MAGFEPPLSFAEAAQRLPQQNDPPVTSIRIESDFLTPEEAIPAFVPHLPTIRSLSLPSQIARWLRPEHIGPYVQHLEFSGRHDRKYWDNKTVTLPPATPFANIESLSGMSYCYRIEARWRFDPAHLPNLRAIGFTFDPKRQFARTLRELHGLIAVSAASFDSIEELAEVLPRDQIVSLTLCWNRTIETLGGIEQFPNLRYLKLSSLTNLRNLDAVAACRKLEFAAIYRSKRIERADALLDLPALNRLEFDGNGNDPKQPTWQCLKDGWAARDGNSGRKT